MTTTTPKPPTWSGSDERNEYFDFATKRDALAFLESRNLTNLSGAVCTAEGKHIGNLVHNPGMPWHLVVRK